MTNPIDQIGKVEDLIVDALGYHRPTRKTKELATQISALFEPERISPHDVEFLLSFAPSRPLPRLGPTFYFTGSYEGDCKLQERIDRIRSALPTPPKEE